MTQSVQQRTRALHLAVNQQQDASNGVAQTKEEVRRLLSLCADCVARVDQAQVVLDSLPRPEEGWLLPEEDTLEGETEDSTEDEVVAGCALAAPRPLRPEELRLHESVATERAHA